jgi:hypothetical protein
MSITGVGGAGGVGGGGSYHRRVSDIADDIRLAMNRQGPRAFAEQIERTKPGLIDDYFDMLRKLEGAASDAASAEALRWYQAAAAALDEAKRRREEKAKKDREEEERRKAKERRRRDGFM